MFSFGHFVCYFNRGDRYPQSALSYILEMMSQSVTMRTMSICITYVSICLRYTGGYFKLPHSNRNGSPECVRKGCSCTRQHCYWQKHHLSGERTHQEYRFCEYTHVRRKIQKLWPKICQPEEPIFCISS